MYQNDLQKETPVVGLKAYTTGPTKEKLISYVCYITDICFVLLSFYFLQHINTTDYRVCIKEIHKPNGYDPVKVATMMVGE